MSETQHQDGDELADDEQDADAASGLEGGGLDDDPALAAELDDDLEDLGDEDEGDLEDDEAEDDLAGGEAADGDVETDAPGDGVDDAELPAGSLSGADQAEDGAATDPHADESPADMVRRLEHEGDVAADYLEELLDIADLDGDIDLDVENGRAMVSIVGDGLHSLVGQGGAALDALQDLTRLAVLRQTGERSRLMLDIAGTRARRREVLRGLAAEAVERVRGDGAPVKLDPMTPFERKVVHDAIAEAGLRSESEGLANARRVVVYPA